MEMKYVTLGCVLGYLLNSINDTKKAEEPVLRPGYDHFSYKTLKYHTGIQKKKLFNHAIKQINEVCTSHPKKSNTS